jgi:hypothetical protein
MKMIGWTTWGMTDRSCDELHATRTDALLCLFHREMLLSQSHLTTDREVYRVGEDWHLYGAADPPRRLELVFDEKTSVAVMFRPFDPNNPATREGGEARGEG